jgi:hypothetical protein
MKSINYIPSPHFLNPFISHGTSELFLKLGSGEQCYSKHGVQVALSSPGTNSFRYAFRSGISSSIYTFVRDLHKRYGFYEPLTFPVFRIYVHTLLRDKVYV